MWRLVVREGKIGRVSQPALTLSRRHVGIKVKAFLVDDFSFWALRRGGGALSRWAFGVVVANGEVGRHVVALAENAAAEYVAAERFVYVDNDVSALEAVHVAYVLEALNRLPRFRAVEVVGSDPRGEVVRRLAEVGASRWKIALQDAVVTGGRAVALSRLVEVAGSCVVRLIDVPTPGALKAAVGLRERLGLPRVGLGDLPTDRWAVVEM
ncbi:MAG: hypothetical protein ACK4M3_06705 [Pyrobaculum sp.]